MKVAYIAGKYRARTEWELIRNIRLAEEFAIKYSHLGYSVICPHKNTAHMGGVLPDAFWLEATMELLRRSDLVVFIPGWEHSEGACAELEEAKRLGKAIVYDDIARSEIA